MAEHAHLVGVAGVGMSALAQAMLAAGWQVSGSDRYVDSGRELGVVATLRRAGVRVVPQDGQGVITTTRVVVASTAIEADNPDIQAALRLGVSVVHRAEMLARIIEGRDCIAITGTSGKTTTTGLVGYLLEQLGGDPTVVNGGVVVNWESDDRVGNVRVGSPSLWVVEADESDRTLLHFHPDQAIITNVSADHFSLDETRRLFETFASQVSGVVIGPLEDPLAGVTVVLSGDGATFTYGGQEFRLGLLGRHNVENAVHAIRLCEARGHSLEEIAEALRGFRGIRRRLEVAGSAAGVTVLDDYAHNPAKIRAAWQAVAPYAERVVAVWRPHGFGPLAKMYDPMRELLAEMVAAGVVAYLLPVYYVGGTAAAATTSTMLADDLAEQGTPVHLVAGYGEVADRIIADARPGDVVLIMGARDPDLPALARRIVDAVAAR